jgi:N,N'-diacetyllegionaminate synthase
MNSINLNFKKKISHNAPCFIIAEIGVNHNGDVNLAKKLIDAAEDSRADAVKFQTFHTEDLILRDSPKAKYHIQTTGSDKKLSWFDLLKSEEMSFEMHQTLFSYCKKKKITFISTPYDYRSVDLLNRLKVEIFKIASCDLNNFPFIKYISSFKKPIILSTGMSNLNEIITAISIIRNQLKRFVIMQCTSSYPARGLEANLNVIDTYKEKFKCLVGYSDHLISNIGAIVAISKGISVYEKHITLDKNFIGPDHRCSLEPREFKILVNEIREAERMLGSNKKFVTYSEKQNIKKMRKNIVSSKNIFKGDKFSINNISIKRTGGEGLTPVYFNKIINKKSKIFIKKDTPININFIKK